MKEELPERTRLRRRPALRIAAGVVAALAVAFGVGEALGWPFLVGPMQRALATALDRRVGFTADAGAGSTVSIRLLGGLSIRAANIDIGAPAWSAEPHTLVAQEAQLKLAYIDLWRAWRGAPLRVRTLEAATLDARLERLADGRSSWQFGPVRADAARVLPVLPQFDRLQVDAGTLQLNDAPLAVDARASFSLREAGDATDAVGATAGPGTTAKAPAGLQLQALGHYGKFPLKVDLRAAGASQAVQSGAVVPWPVSLDAHIGRAIIVFKGTATDPLHFAGLQGEFTLKGPSLAAVGDPVHITLPTTGAFTAHGVVAKQDALWNVVLAEMGIGSSRLAGAFTFDPRPAVPLLAGRLTGTRLLLADLGPAVGARAPAATAATPTAADLPAGSTRPGRVLPDRPFDLPALRAMNANVLVDIDTVDLGSGLLEPVKPLRAHLVLADAVLALRDLDARTGQGRLTGNVQLDGRQSLALWTSDLRWSGVRLERWIHQARANNAAPYVSGNLSGQARVAGQGKSTAAILGSLRGTVRMQVQNGSISHLLVEAAGIDLAQGLGMLIKGDDSLPIHCMVADMVADQGLLRPRALVIDTSDSTLWMEGSVSLATEALELDVHVAPKDFSPLTLRTPIHLRGTFLAPRVSLDTGRLGARVGVAALLGLLNPVAALIPFIDVGSADEAQRGAAGCAQLARRMKAQPTLPAPPAVTRSQTTATRR